jgi:hypothetical protein
MLISKQYARRLIKQGKAAHGGYTRNAVCYYAIIDRYDKQRTDHYYVAPDSKEYRSWQ